MFQLKRNLFVERLLRIFDKDFDGGINFLEFINRWVQPLRRARFV